MGNLSEIAGMDVYLIDQILKGRYRSGEQVLDAGAGSGRNLNWFLANGLKVTAVDADSACEGLIRERYGAVHFTWHQAVLDELPFQDAAFDHVICNAVLHFAENEEHFQKMFKELLRVLKKGGSLFIRTCLDIGIEKEIRPLGSGRFLLPDGSERFLLTRDLFDSLVAEHELRSLGPLKGTHVVDKRVMGTIVLAR